MDASSYPHVAGQFVSLLGASLATFGPIPMGTSLVPPPSDGYEGFKSIRFSPD